MTRRTVFVLAFVIAVMVLIGGCATKDDTVTARFIRYQSVGDGTRVAVVAPTGVGGDAGEQRAYAALSDLKPGELVLVREGGRSWDQPQSRPSVEVVSRAPSK
jgi:hypothetical protein